MFFCAFPLKHRACLWYDKLYERAGPKARRGARPPLVSAFGRRTPVAVSYTHLDVYKRQTMARAMRPAIPVRMAGRTAAGTAAAGSEAKWP